MPFEGGAGAERGAFVFGTAPRHVILNLIQDPLPRLFPRADAQMGSFCRIQQSFIEQAVEATNVK